MERFTISTAIPEKAKTRSGDILLQKAGVSLKVMLVQDDLAGCAVADSVLILRPRSQSVPSDIVFQIMSSGAGKRLLAEGAGVPTISTTRLKQLEIPILPLGIQRQLAWAQDVEEQVQQIATRLAALRESTFVADSKEDFERHLLSVQKMRRLRSRQA